MAREFWRPLFAEAIGTFALVFAGCGAIMVEAKTERLGHLGIAITFGLVIMAMIYAVGHISGAHFNPAVTFAFSLTRHFPWSRALGYWAAQLAGATLAALLLRASLGDLADVGATLPSGSDGQSFLWEVVLTFFLMFVIMAVATDTRAVGEAAAIAIGGTIALDALVGGPISGASMIRHARSARRSSRSSSGRSGSISLLRRSERSPTKRCAAKPRALDTHRYVSIY